MNLRIAVKLAATVFACIMLMLGIGFCFDSGTGLEIAGRVLFVVVLFAFFVRALWRNEVSSAPGGITNKKIILWTSGILIVLFLRACLVSTV